MHHEYTLVETVRMLAVKTALLTMPHCSGIGHTGTRHFVHIIERYPLEGKKCVETVCYSKASFIFRVSFIIGSIVFPSSTIEFIYNFLECFLNGENDMVVCGHVAYELSFKRYHNLVIRGIFQVDKYS